MRNRVQKSVTTPKFLSVTEAEVMTGLSRWTWRRMAYDGRISSCKVSRRLLIPLEEITRIIAEGMRPRLEVVEGRK
jgi:hypothetical protein